MWPLQEVVNYSTRTVMMLSSNLVLQVVVCGHALLSVRLSDQTNPLLLTTDGVDSNPAPTSVPGSVVSVYVCVCVCVCHQLYG